VRLKQAEERARVVAKLGLVHARYVFGTLGTALLVSVPIDVGYRLLHEEHADTSWLGPAGVSVLYGLLCFAVFASMIPFTRIDWGRMRVPEFQTFELSISRSAMIASAVLLVASFIVRFLSHDGLVHALLPRRLFWTVFVLMAIAWAKIWIQTKLFPEFYADVGGERVLDAATELARLEQRDGPGTKTSGPA
jgi:hypothetical protein